jgi:hypothetical protein
MTAQITAAGRTWHVTPLGVEAQFEVEVMFGRVFGAAAAYGVAAAVEGLVPALISALRKLTGEGEDFDLAGIMQLWEGGDEDDDSTGFSRDPRVRDAWETMLEALAETAGDVVVRALPTITDRLDLADVRRLFELVVIRGCCPEVDGRGQRLADWAAVARLLAGHPPAAKWELLSLALAVTYAGRDDEGEG